MVLSLFKLDTKYSNLGHCTASIHCPSELYSQYHHCYTTIQNHKCDDSGEMHIKIDNTSVFDAPVQLVAG